MLICIWRTDRKDDRVVIQMLIRKLKIDLEKRFAMFCQKDGWGTSVKCSSCSDAVVDFEMEKVSLLSIGDVANGRRMFCEFISVALDMKNDVEIWERKCACCALDGAVKHRLSASVDLTELSVCSPVRLAMPIGLWNELFFSSQCKSQSFPAANKNCFVPIIEDLRYHGTLGDDMGVQSPNGRGRFVA